MAFQALQASNQLGWLNSASKWRNGVGDGWVGKKILGQGGQGIAGHWSYEGSDRDSKPLKEVVVKQGLTTRSDGTASGGLTGEAEMLRLLDLTGSRHILKMYRSLYVDQGGGHLRIDHGEVHRIFLEYCPGGDLFDWILRKRRTSTNIEEVELWGMFHCLALATLAIHHGREDANANRWNRDEICHFDLKLDNILLGELTTDTEHINARPLKIADFGLAVSVPNVQDKRFHDEHAYRGTVTWLLPEQIVKYRKEYQRPWIEASGTKITSLRFGTASNIWQIGMIMWCLLRRMNEPTWQVLQTYQSSMSRRLQRGGETLGTVLDQNEGKDAGPPPKYSKHLRAVISECMLIQSSSRLLPADLVEKTRRGLATARATAPTPITPIPNPYTCVEPQLDQRWYSGATKPPPEQQKEDESTPSELFMVMQGRNAVNAQAQANAASRAAALAKQRAEWDALQKARAARNNPLAMNPTAPHAPATPATPATPLTPHPQAVPGTPPGQLQLGVPRTPQAPAPVAAAPTTPFSPTPQNICCIITIKPNVLGLGGGQKVERLKNVNAQDTIWQLKQMLEMRNCGIAAWKMQLSYGRRIFRNDERLGEIGTAGAYMRVDQI